MEGASGPVLPQRCALKNSIHKYFKYKSYPNRGQGVETPHPGSSYDGFDRDEFWRQNAFSTGSSDCSAVAAFSFKLQVPEKCSDPESIFLGI